MLDKDMFSTNIFNIANVDAEKIFNSIDEDEKETSPGRKRRKLDDFTPQERMIRRKLKNRVAAQTARDKKRERMTELEKVVCRLENENKDLKKSNDDLKLRMEQLIEQNEELRIHVGIDKPNTNNNDHTYTRKADSAVTDQAVIKKEEVSKEHASLKISQQKKLRALLVSLITIWLANPRLMNYLGSLNESSQERFLKGLLRKKLVSQMNSSKTYKSVEALLRTNLKPIFQDCLRRIQVNYLTSAETFRTWSVDPVVI